MKSDALILEDLKEKTKGLIWISESDYPFYVVMNPPVKLKQALSTQELSNFFSHVTRLNKNMSRGERSIVRKYQKLEMYLYKHLKNVKVYKFPNPKIPALFDLYIVGKTSSGAYLGIRTTAVET